MTITSATKPLFCSLCTYFQEQCPQLHRTTLQVYLGSSAQSFCSVWNYFGIKPSSRTYLLSTVKLLSSGSLYPDLQKKINISAPTGNKRLNLFLITFPDERVEGETREEEFFFLFQLISISVKSQ